MLTLCSPGMLFVLVVAAAAQPAPASTAILNLAHGPDPVAAYDRFEITFELDASYANPFDPDEVDVRVEFAGPASATRTIPAFWYEGYDLWLNETQEAITPNGNDTWMARLVGTATGEHRYRVRVDDAHGSSASEWRTFVCMESDSAGFVRADARDGRFLAFDDGTPYVPIGHNICWPRYSGGFDILYWQAKMAANGENWGRYWLSQHTAYQALEWKAGRHWPGLGRYSQPIAARVDTMLEDARARGIYIQLALDSFNAWNYSVYPNWDDNPYNRANGGMLDAPHEYLTHPEARRLARNRFRYIVARWGFSTAILCWEFFNEIDILGAGGPPSGFFVNRLAEGVAWHREMAQFIRELDPYAHLRTTSFSNQSSWLRYPEIWELPEMDLVQVHRYSDNSPEAHIGLLDQARVYGKPVILGEWGVENVPMLAGTQHSGLPTLYVPFLVSDDGGDLPAGLSSPLDDPVGRNLHDAIWAVALIGSGAMSWWWDNYIDPNDLYPLFAPLSRFMAGEDWAAHDLALNHVSYDVLSGHNVELYGSSGWNNVYFWVRDRADGTVDGLVLAVHGLIDADKTVEYWDSYSGAVLERETVPVTGGTLELRFPAFERDAAVKVVGLAGSPTPTPTVTPTSTPRGSNLVHNPGAELGTLEGWTSWQEYPYDIDGPPVSYPGRAILALDVTIQPPAGGNRHSGNHAFGAVVGYASARGGMYQEIDVDPGGTYRLSVWVATGGPDHDAIRIGWLDGVETWVRDAGVPGAPVDLGNIGAGQDWTRISGEIVPSAPRITIYADWRHELATGVASFFVDDWELERTDAPPPPASLLELR